MKLNVGCGRHVLDGWTNIDIQPSRHSKVPPNILCDLRSIPLADSCAREVMAIHVFEHFYLWEIPAVITEWKRLLRPRGILILEMPNLVKCCHNIIHGIGLEGGGKNPHAMGLWGLYGDPRDEDPYMHHKWGWSPSTLTTLLTSYGFGKIRETVTQWHRGGRDNRDMRIEAVKL